MAVPAMMDLSKRLESGSLVVGLLVGWFVCLFVCVFVCVFVCLFVKLLVLRYAVYWADINIVWCDCLTLLWLRWVMNGIFRWFVVAILFCRVNNPNFMLPFPPHALNEDVTAALVAEMNAYKQDLLSRLVDALRCNRTHWHPQVQ